MTTTEAASQQTLSAVIGKETAPGYSVGFAASALLTALSVGVLTLSAMGLMLGGIVGVGLFRLGLPEAVIWPVIGVAGLVSLVIACRLGLKVWRFEISQADESRSLSA